MGLVTQNFFDTHFPPNFSFSLQDVPPLKSRVSAKDAKKEEKKREEERRREEKRLAEEKRKEEKRREEQKRREEEQRRKEEKEREREARRNRIAVLPAPEGLRSGVSAPEGSRGFAPEGSRGQYAAVESDHDGKELRYEMGERQQRAVE